MIQRLRETLTLVLLTLLPFHAFLVTVGTKAILGPGRPPWSILAVWKEALLLVLLLLVCGELLVEQRRRRLRLDYESVLRRMDLLDVLILCLIALSSLSFSLIRGGVGELLQSYLYGFKYDFLPLIVFLLLRRVPWREVVRHRVLPILLLVSILTVVFGIASLTLPIDAFTTLGYSALHSIYLPGEALPAFHLIGGTAIRRLQSTFSGPNQFALWLLAPWSLAVVFALARREWAVGGLPRWMRTVVQQERPLLRLLPRWTFALGIGLAIVLTFSRSAWIAAVAIAIVAAWGVLPTRSFRRFLIVVTTGAVGVLLILLSLAPSVLVRGLSTAHHLSRMRGAVAIIARETVGRGLGQAGPAHHRSSDPCVFLEEGSDASWASDRPNLCVFVGEIQVQPFDSAPVQGLRALQGLERQGKPVPCRCAVLPESWYLQIGVELGVVGLVLYLLIVLGVFLAFLRRGEGDLSLRGAQLWRDPLSSVAFLSFLGVSIAGLFLHSFEDSAVAYTTWILLALSLPPALARAK